MTGLFSRDTYFNRYSKNTEDLKKIETGQKGKKKQAKLLALRQKLFNLR